MAQHEQISGKLLVVEDDPDISRLLKSNLTHMGFEVSVATDGAEGLKQALTGEPTLIILDEASARLDPISEARLEIALTQLLAGRAAIIIAHRLQTIRLADRVLILDNGAVVEEGNYQELSGQPDSWLGTLLQQEQERHQ